MPPKWFSIVEFVVVVLVCGIIAVGLYFLFTKDDADNVILSPAETPQETTGITPTNSPSPSPAFPSPMLNSPASAPKNGVTGGVTLNSCVSGSCSVQPLANTVISIRDLSNNVLATLYTNSAGRFRIVLDPGQYLIGPVVEPASKFSLGPANVIVKKGGFSEVEFNFRSDQ